MSLPRGKYGHPNRKVPLVLKAGDWRRISEDCLAGWAAANCYQASLSTGAEWDGMQDVKAKLLRLARFFGRLVEEE